MASVATGGSHTCAVKTDGSLWCWGLNLYGEVGDGSGMNQNAPVQIAAVGTAAEPATAVWESVPGPVVTFAKGTTNVPVVSVAGFVVGWIFQFIGHAFEGKPPEFFQDWRFLFVGLRWWFAKIAGKA